MNELATYSGVAPYQVTAEFYDLLHGVDYRQRARRLLSFYAAQAQVAILEVGAGSGLVTTVLAEVSAVPVHAVEPSQPMRALLLGRLADSTKLVRQRVTVHAAAVQDVGLREMADLAVCINVASCWDPAQRRAAWRAIGQALIPDGVLVLDWPLESADVTGQSAESETVTVGRDEYGGRLTIVGCGGGRARMDVTYQVRRSGVLLREESESFDMWLVGRRQLLAELAATGLRLGPEGDGGGDSPLLRVYRCV
ncbi:MAG: class I SAM-dependent methyltransferase [Pseudonocardiaceae bacterium]